MVMSVLMFMFLLNNDVIAIIIEDGLYSVRKGILLLVQEFIIPVLVTVIGKFPNRLHHTVFKHRMQFLPARINLSAQIFLILLTQIGRGMFLYQPPGAEILFLGFLGNETEQTLLRQPQESREC